MNEVYLNRNAGVMDMSEGSLVRTALYDEHVSLGGNIVDFHGFELPIWYSNIKAEHLATRETSGLFDVSHMGTFRFTGANVLEWLEGVATQKVTSIPVGRCAYTHFLDRNGYIIDDMIFAVVSETEVLGVPNASMIDIMWKWFHECSPEESDVTIENLSPDYSIIALQGPDSKKLLDKPSERVNMSDDSNGLFSLKTTLEWKVGFKERDTQERQDTRYSFQTHPLLMSGVPSSMQEQLPWD